MCLKMEVQDVMLHGITEDENKKKRQELKGGL